MQAMRPANGYRKMDTGATSLSTIAAMAPMTTPPEPQCTGLTCGSAISLRDLRVSRMSSSRYQKEGSSLKDTSDRRLNLQPGLVPAGGVFAHDVAGSGISRAPAARANELVLAPPALAFDVSPIPQLLQYS